MAGLVRRDIRILGAVSTLTLALALWPETALADCQTTGPSTPEAPQTGAVVVCSPPAPETTPITAVPGSTNVRVEVQSGADVATGASTAITVRSFSAISNSGTIRTTFAADEAITGTSGNNALTNRGTIIGAISFGGGNNMVTNSGTITELDIGSGAIITAGNNNRVTNTGRITAAAFGMNGIDVSGSNNVVTNSDMVSATGSFARGITVFGGNNTIINTGTVNVTGASSRGISAGGANNTIINSGHITVSGNDDSIGIRLGVANGEAATLVNAAGGSITSHTSLAFVGASGINRVENDGTLATGVAGSFAVDLRAGADALVLGPTSVITGLVTGGDDMDALALGGTGEGAFDASLIGPTAQYRDFELFEKVGSSTWTLVGAGNQGFTVREGTLLVNGTLSGTQTVVGGVLGGIGTIGGLDARARGTVNPGSPAAAIGALNVAGNLTFGSGSFYAVNANVAGQSDRLAATGTATINGGTVQVQAAQGAYDAPRTYMIVSAAGGRTGAFSAVTSNFAFLTPSLSYDANNVFLTLARNTAVFSDVALTPNQFSVGTGLGLIPNENPLFLALLSQSPESARAAFDLLSGEVHASAQSVLVEDSRYPRQAVLARLRQDAYAGLSGPLGTLAFGGPATYMADLPQRAAALAPQPAARPAFTVWAQALGAWGKFDGDGNAARVDRDLGGLFGGFDTDFGEVWRVGLSAGYTRSDLDLNARLGSAEIDAGHVAAYAGARFGALSARFGGAVSLHDVGTRRAIAFPGFSDRATAGYDAATGQVFGEIGWGLALGQFALEPFGGLAWVRVETDDFREAGGAAALVGTDNTFETGYSTLGLRLGTSFALVNGMALLPRLTVAWQHAFDNMHPTAGLAFAAGGAPFSVRGAPIARDSLLVEAGLDLAVTARARVGVSYAGALADCVEDHAVKANLNWSF